ncbi:MAG: hypothetical protein WAU77_03345 [Solirubrobacteraceae bacterium]
MTTEKRTSEQGNVFSVAIIREFLLAALSHDAVTDAVDAMLFEHVVEGRIHPSVITENLRPLITEVLDVATSEDWHNVCCKLIEDACESIGDLPSEPTRSTAQQQPDPGEMREELGHLYAQKPLSPRKARRAWQLIRKISRLVGISVNEVRANAREDAEAVQAADEYDAVRADRSSAQTPASPAEPVIEGTPLVVAAYRMLRHLADRGDAAYIEDTRGKEIQGWVTGVAAHEVSVEEIRTRQNTYIRLADIENMEEIEAVFVRPLSRHEASTLLDAGESPHSWTRKRAAILLASNFGNTVTEIVAKQKADAWFVRRVIAAFNESGLKSLEGSTLTTIALDNGQFNLLISGLGLARLALNGCGDEFVGFATDYSQLADEIVAQLPGDGPAPRAARERLAIQEGRATSIRKPS